MADLWQADFVTARWLFLRGLGLVSAIAFASLLPQIRGLYGARGISPIAAYLDGLRPLGRRRFRLVPSLFWVDARDRTLLAVAWVGLAASLAVALDLTTIPGLVVAWVCYLAFVAAGQEFLAFQWDAFLLELLALGTVYAAVTPPPWWLTGLVWFVVFRFMFQSGAAKLLSGDRTWRDLTAMRYHYETQPLPSPLAWWAHQLPLWVHKATTAAVHLIETGLPILVFGPRPARLAVVAAWLVLMVAIMATGSYGFFNLLTIVALIPFVPDDLWARLGVGTAAAPGGLVAPVAVAAGALAALNLAQLVSVFAPRPWLLAPLAGVAPFRLVNRYGLFAVMTTVRYEITVEGSDDGTTWRTYRFRWKPGPLDRRPRWNIPHQPRLDWQMWFAALGPYTQNPWFLRFCARLLEGEPTVTRLLEEDPFEGRPPRFLRTVYGVYRFTDLRTRRATGRWWSREDLGLYAPILARTDEAPDLPPTDRPLHDERPIQEDGPFEREGPVEGAVPRDRAD